MLDNRILTDLANYFSVDEILKSDKKIIFSFNDFLLDNRLI